MGSLAAFGMFGIVIVLACVFVSVLSVVGLVKLLQIAEDIRYMRSRNDVNVQRPRSWKNTLAVCLIVSLIIVFLVGFFLLTAPSMLQGISR